VVLSLLEELAVAVFKVMGFAGLAVAPSSFVGWAVVASGPVEVVVVVSAVVVSHLVDLATVSGVV
jgi:hypothetical protein